MPSRFRVITWVCVHQVAGPWLFPLPPWPSPVSELTFEASPDDRLPGAPAAVQARPLSLQVCSLRDLHSPSETLLSCWDRCRPSSPAVHLECPSTSALACVHSRSALPPSFGRTVPPVRSCSVLVVSHHLDGLLRLRAFGLVASRSRPWGSSHFLLRPPAVPHRPDTEVPVTLIFDWGDVESAARRASHPSKASPPR